MPAISFLNSRAYHSDGRPYANVILTNDNGTQQSPSFLCLVDTGADYTILPLWALQSIGASPANKTKNLIGPGGKVALLHKTGLRLVVEDCALINQEVLFDSNNSMAYPPVLGRATLLSAFDVGFDVHQWLWS